MRSKLNAAKQFEYIIITFSSTFSSTTASTESRSSCSSFTHSSSLLLTAKNKKGTKKRQSSQHLSIPAYSKQTDIAKTVVKTLTSTDTQKNILGVRNVQIHKQSPKHNPHIAVLTSNDSQQFKFYPSTVSITSIPIPITHSQ